MFEPTSEQRQALEQVSLFLNDDSSVFILKGYAGTGKTSIISEIVKSVRKAQRNVAIMAPTGRAAKILRDKLGEEATTIHQAIYKFSEIEINEDTDDEEFGIQYHFPLKSITECNSQYVYIVDEASMISSKKSSSELLRFGSGVLLEDLLKYSSLAEGGKIIFIGDPAQLPPVGDSNSYALDETYFTSRGIKVRSAVLSQVIRQDSGSAILENSFIIRNCFENPNLCNLVLKQRAGSFEEIARDAVVDAITENSSTPSLLSPIIITYENARAAYYNKLIRNRYFPGNNDTIQPGDILQITSNNYNFYTRSIYNGDFAVVLTVSKDIETQSASVWTTKDGVKERVTVPIFYRNVTLLLDDGASIDCKIIENVLKSNKTSLTLQEVKSMYVNFCMRNKMFANDPAGLASAMKNDPFYNALQVKYGYAITCHKAQGGEWDNVIVDYSGRNGLNGDCLRWCYTATTRARKQLRGINIPEITPLEKLKFAQIMQAKNAPEFYYALEDVPLTPFHKEDSRPLVRWKYIQIAQTLSETAYSIHSVVSKPWREVYAISFPEGRVVNYEATYGKGGVFSHFVCKESDAQAMEVRSLLDNAECEYYELHYKASTDAFQVLFNNIQAICADTGIKIMNVVEFPAGYKLTYCLKTSGKFAWIDFNFTKKGFITYALPHSDSGANDELLTELIRRMS